MNTKSVLNVALEKPGFTQGLHDLTVAGYEKGITIPVIHSEGVATIFLNPVEGMSPIDRYIDFASRLKAINEAAE